MSTVLIVLAHEKHLSVRVSTVEAMHETLTDRDRDMLALERLWWQHAGTKDQEIKDRFCLSATSYYQALNAYSTTLRYSHLKPGHCGSVANAWGSEPLDPRGHTARSPIERDAR